MYQLEAFLSPSQTVLAASLFAGQYHSLAWRVFGHIPVRISRSNKRRPVMFLVFDPSQNAVF